MGVESDRLVLDYLSRVGDLAQTALPAAERRHLVAQLRNDIDRRRGGSDTPATVRRILGRIGTPDAVVEAAAGSTSAGSGTSGASRTSDAPSRPEAPAEPPPGSYGPYAKRQVPKARAQEARAPRDQDEEPDWWRVNPGSAAPPRVGDELAGLPGMTGGVFIPFDDEDLAGSDAPPPKPRRHPEDADEEPYEEEEEDPAPPRRAPRRLLPGLLRKRDTAGSGDTGGTGRAPKRWGSPVLLLAAALLIAGAAIGSWIPLGLGWLTGYLSRKLTRPQAKFAVLGIPGTAAVGMLVWLWGRNAGKWSTPIAQGQMGQAVQDALPGTVRLAAIGTALYLLWRARRTA